MLRTFLLANRRGLALIVGGCIGLALLAIVALDGYVLGLTQGTIFVLAPAMVLLLFMAQTGAIWQYAGYLGEDNTNDELKRAARKAIIWGFVENIELADGDIDHVVLAPSGAYALDSKWHARKIDGRTAQRDAASAEDGARKARSVLRSLKLNMPVVPVVVVWGSGQHDVPSGGSPVNGVDLVAGKELVEWLARRSSGVLSGAEAKPILGQLRDFRRRIDPMGQQPARRKTPRGKAKRG